LKRELKAAAIFSLVLMAMTMAAFYPASVGKALIYSGDFTGSDGLDLNLPLKANLGRALTSLHFPLWTPHLLCGYPLLGEGQTGMFYPFNIIFSLLGPLWCFNGLIMLHIFISGLGMYCYARHRELSHGSSALAGVVFAFSSFHVLHARQLNLLEAVSWAPWLFLFGERHIRGRKPADLLLWSLILSLQWLCGHPAITYLVLLGLAVLYLAGWIKDIRQKGKGCLYILPLGFICGTLLSMGMAALQIIPTLELIPLSLRSSLSFQGATKYPFTPSDLMYLITPFFRGNPADATYMPESIYSSGVFWENCIYIGAVPVLLAILSLLRLQTERRVQVCVIVLMAAIVLAFGAMTPLYSIMWHAVPGFHLFRFPSRFLFFALFALSMLAGLSWDYLSGLIRSLRVRWAVTAMLIVVSFVNLLWFNVSFNGAAPVSWLDRPSSMRYISQSSVPPSRVYTYAPFYSWQKAWREDRGWLGDRAGKTAGPGEPSGKASRSSLDRYRGLLAPDYNLVFGVSQVGEKTYIEGGMAPKQRARLEEQLENRACARKVGPVVILGDELVRILAMENVEFITSEFMLAHPMISKVSEDDGSDGVKVYRLRDTLPRAFCVYRARVVPAGGEAMRLLLSEDFKAGEEVILEEEPPLKLSGIAGTSKTEILKYDDCEVRLKVSSDEPALLFISDTWFPGWKAYVDGAERKIMCANHAFRAVAVEKGEHDVVFRYAPLSFTIGLVISLLFIVSWVALLCSCLRKGSPEGNQE